MSKYSKQVPGMNGTIDVYDVLIAFDVRCPARQHAIKKLLMAGERGHKCTIDDLKESGQSVERAIQIESALQAEDFS